MSLLNFQTKYDNYSSYSVNSLYGYNSNSYNYFKNINNLFKNYKYNSPIKLNNYSIQLSTPKIKLQSGYLYNMLNDAGYDAEKGKLLTDAAKKRAREHNWTGFCARSVRLTLEETNLGSKNGNGHAYQYAMTLANNRNFKEIDVSNLSTDDLKELSKFDGIIYVYDRGVSSYSKKSGHIEISLGNGTNGSDGITHNIRKGARVFIPVKTSITA